VTLKELNEETLSVNVVDSNAVALAEKVGFGVSEGDKVAMLEINSAADDDILGVVDVLDVVDKLVTTEGVTDDVSCSDKERIGVALTLSDIKEDRLA
jgi:hypothetical protein